MCEPTIIPIHKYDTDQITSISLRNSTISILSSTSDKMMKKLVRKDIERDDYGLLKLNIVKNVDLMLDIDGHVGSTAIACV